MIKQTKEERKISARISARKFNASEKGKAYRAEYNSRPEVIARLKEYRDNLPREKKLEYWRKYNASDKCRQKRAEYEAAHPEVAERAQVFRDQWARYQGWRDKK